MADKPIDPLFADASEDEPQRSVYFETGEGFGWLELIVGTLIGGAVAGATILIWAGLL